MVADLLMPLLELGQWHQLPGGLEPSSSTSLNNGLNKAVKLISCINLLCLVLAMNICVMKQEVNVLLSQTLDWEKPLWGRMSCALNWLGFHDHSFYLKEQLTANCCHSALGI